MREKELRLALVCYGGISLAVYMHGITKEIWRLARASQAYHSGDEATGDSACVYRRLLHIIADECGIELRVLVDILAGASAGGINAIFLGEAIASGVSLDPLTDLWLETADVDKLIDPEVSTVSRFAKAAAVPFAWMLSSRSGTVEQTVEPAHRAEVRTKLANFVRGRWFDPPFGGTIFTNLLLDAFDAMKKGPQGPPLLPGYQPLDLFVTVTDFHGYPERLRLHSPAEVVEQEHRITLSFRSDGGGAPGLADPAELAFAARATASFPGAFPPFQVKELDAALAARGQEWTGRGAFLQRALPRHAAIGEAENATLIDGSVLANAPFGPALAALDDRPARREVDRRFVYIDPTPGRKSIRMTGGEEAETPGFFATLFGALSDIPREQPIRDNLEAIDRRSSRIRRMTRIVEAMRPEVEAAIEHAFGMTLLLTRPTPARIASWRFKANNVAAKEAGFAYPAYGHLKLSVVVEDIAAMILRLSGGAGRHRHEAVRKAVWKAVRRRRLDAEDAMTARGARPDVIEFMRRFDIGFRARRLRFLAKRFNEIDERGQLPREAATTARETIYSLIGLYRDAARSTSFDAALLARFAAVEADADGAMEALADLLSLQALDTGADTRLSEALAALPSQERRALILAYLGYPFYDIATLPLLQGEGHDEFNPIKVDRISPDDATGIREGGAEATLKGIQFNSFGAFFSRAYRENDYLWGRLHGADRLIDILVSTLPEGKHLPPGTVAGMKKEAFAAILRDERGRCGASGALIDQLEREIGISS
jgi:patatin-related protein